MKTNLTMLVSAALLLVSTVAMADTNDSVNCGVSPIIVSVTYDAQTKAVVETWTYNGGIMSGTDIPSNGIGYSLLDGSAALNDRGVQYAVEKLGANSQDLQSAAIFFLQSSPSTPDQTIKRELIKLNGKNGQIGAVIAFVPDNSLVPVAGPAACGN